MANGRCRWLGGLTPQHNSGPKTEEGKMRQKMGSWKHGLRSKEAIAEKSEIRNMMKHYKEILRWHIR
jgi:hypothetical protein